MADHPGAKENIMTGLMELRVDVVINGPHVCLRLHWLHITSCRYVYNFCSLQWALEPQDEAVIHGSHPSLSS